MWRGSQLSASCRPAFAVRYTECHRLNLSEVQWIAEENCTVNYLNGNFSPVQSLKFKNMFLPPCT